MLLSHNKYNRFRNGSRRSRVQNDQEMLETIGRGLHKARHGTHEKGYYSFMIESELLMEEEGDFTPYGFRGCGSMRCNLDVGQK